MTVLLVLFTILVFIGIDALREYFKKAVAIPMIPEDAFVHEWGLTMADGGEKVEETPKPKEEEYICPKCGKKRETKSGCSPNQ